MGLPLQPPIAPQPARGKPELPVGESWAYEPKYDGFRALAFVDGEELILQSRAPSHSSVTSRSCASPPGATCWTVRS